MARATDVDSRTSLRSARGPIPRSAPHREAGTPAQLHGIPAPSGPIERVIRLQRSAGNAAVARLLPGPPRPTPLPGAQPSRGLVVLRAPDPSSAPGAQGGVVGQHASIMDSVAS